MHHSKDSALSQYLDMDTLFMAERGRSKDVTVIDAHGRGVPLERKKSDDEVDGDEEKAS